MTLLLDETGAGACVLRKWCARCAGPVAWVNLRGNAGNLNAFLAAVWPALHAAGILPHDPTSSPGSADDFLNLLAGVESDFVLVLDGYDSVTEPAVHAAVSLWVDYAPPALHLVLVVAVPPSLPLARWRVRRQLLEVTVYV